METNLTVNDPVKSFLVINPKCVEVFRELNIDFCCGGNASLLSASKEIGLEPQQVFERLIELPDESSDTQKDISGLTQAELADHIESTHHVYLKQALPRLTILMDKVYHAHLSRHPELMRLKTVLQSLRNDLEPHLLKEERVLFPLIRKLDRESLGLQMKALNGPIRVMRNEHDGAGVLLKEMSKLTNGYIPPEDGCESFNLLYK